MTFTMVVFGSAFEGGPPDIFFMVVHFGQIRIIQRFCSTFVGESKHPYSVCLCVYVCIYTHTSYWDAVKQEQEPTLP